MTEQSSARVECYSGYTYPQEPRIVVWQGTQHHVTRIERRWHTPEGPAFSVETEQGPSFELHYNELADVWTIQPHPDFDSEPLDSADQAADDLERSSRNHH